MLPGIRPFLLSTALAVVWHAAAPLAAGRFPGDPAELPPSLQEIVEAIGPAAARQAITGIASVAEATGPRGAFVSEMLSLDDGTARFRLIKDGEATELLLSDGRAYHRDRKAAAAGGDLLAADAGGPFGDFVRGHEVHRMVLDLDRRFRPVGPAASPDCLLVRPADPVGAPVGRAGRLCRSPTTGLPATIELNPRDAGEAAAGDSKVILELGDWRKVQGVNLPFAVDFVRAGERHAYRYSSVLPFRIAAGAPLPDDPATLLARLDDLAALAAAHERVLEAHRRSDVRLLLEDAPERSLQSGRGILKETGRAEVAARLGPYLEGIRFSRYEDVVVPIVALSVDGSLGWLACEIDAAGMQEVEGKAPEAIAYGFSWVELYARKEGRWQAIGNASSARP